MSRARTRTTRTRTLALMQCVPPAFAVVVHDEVMPIKGFDATRLPALQRRPVDFDSAPNRWFSWFASVEASGCGEKSTMVIVPSGGVT